MGQNRIGFCSTRVECNSNIMTMAKATTNGVVPMGVVAVKEEIYD